MSRNKIIIAAVVGIIIVVIYSAFSIDSGDVPEAESEMPEAEATE